MKTALVLGAGGFIGGHLVSHLVKKLGYWVRGVDIKQHEYDNCPAHDFVLADLTEQQHYPAIFDRKFDEVYQLAADMGGAQYIFTGENDANIMYNSALINLNVVHWCMKTNVGCVFFSSSACVYPAYNQTDPDNPKCSEDTVVNVFAPDSNYGLEKITSERLYLAFNKNYGLNVRIARFHNIFGPMGTYVGGKEKAPAALCRKIAMANDGECIEMIGDGKQTRSFLYVDECIEGIMRLMRSDFIGPVNIGSEEMVTINQLVDYISEIAGKTIGVNHIEGPQGVRGRNSDNKLIYEKLGWKPSQPLKVGLMETYKWINEMMHK